jgi:hypothetical protein
MYSDGEVTMKLEIVSVSPGSTFIYIEKEEKTFSPESLSTVGPIVRLYHVTRLLRAKKPAKN